MSEKLVVDGFIFRNRSEYEKAKKEHDAINELKKKIDVSDQESVMEIYNRLVSKKMFQTAVGLSFLHEMQEYLRENNENISVPYVPVIISSRARSKELQSKQYNKLQADYNRQLAIKNRLILAIVSMTIIILGMIFIVISNDNLGYFKAEEKVLNKYSAWEERLKDWEEELTIREDELNARENEQKAFENQSD